MTTTLFLAWQASASRRWFPVGRLDAEPDGYPSRYESHTSRALARHAPSLTS